MEAMAIVDKFELEAAEALAALAFSTENTNALAFSTENTDAQDDVLFNKDEENLIHRHYVKTHNLMPDMVKIDQYAGLQKNPCCVFSNIGSGSCKSRLNMTEAEKELKKLRRVLANRESARQTIRRRQAFHDELMRKAADLELENENLKREKEFAMKKYDSSKSKNELLKAKFTKLSKTEDIAEEESKNVDVPTSSCPIFVYGQPPYSPFTWHSLVQTSNTAHTQAPMGPTANPESYFMLPFPCFFPFPQKDSGSESQLHNLNGSTTEENRVSHFVQTEASDSVDPTDIPQGGSQVTKIVKPGDSYQQEKKKKSLPVGPVELPENYLSIFQYRKVDAVSAAVARRRRKEVTRLKNPHFHVST